MIRVLHIGLSSNGGGIENVVLSWARRLPEDIHFSLLNVEDKKLAYEDEFIALGCDVIKVAPRKKGVLKYRKCIREILTRGEYNFVHCHVMSYSAYDPVIVANEFKNIKPIIHIHIVVGKHQGLKVTLLHYLGKAALKKQQFLKLACGEEAGRSIFQADSYEIIENGIDVERFSFKEAKRKEIREKLNIDNEIFLIGHVGRPGKQKNYPFIIKAFSDLYKADKNIRLLLVGDIDKDEAVQALIKTAGIQEMVICPGKVDASTYYSAMDAFFFPSLFEGFSVALVEAQAAGLSCVVADTVDAGSAISGHVYFVSIRDTAQAVEKLLEIKNGSGKRESFGNELYNIRNSSKKMFEYYRSQLREN